MKKDHREVVVMLIHNQKKELLFTKRSLNRKILPDIWALPSGHINIGQENFKEAATRECKEEFNIDISNVNLYKIIDRPNGDNVLVYLVNIPADGYKGNPIVNTDEFDSLLWMKIEDFFKKFNDKEIGPTLQYLRSEYQK